MSAIIKSEPRWRKTETEDYEGTVTVTREAWFSKPVSIREFEADGWKFVDCRCGPSSWVKIIEESQDRFQRYEIFKRDRWNKYGIIRECVMTRSTATTRTR